MIDIFYLKWKNIRNEFLYFTREKTKYTARTVVQIEIFLTLQAQTIIEKWKIGGRKNETTIFSKSSTNSYLLPKE